MGLVFVREGVVSNNGSFVAEVFSGLNIEHFKVIPSADGEQLGISFLPPEGEPISVIVAQADIEPMVLEIAKGLEVCQQRIKQNTGRVTRLSAA